jgi:molecular chaperone GrpE
MSRKQRKAAGAERAGHDEPAEPIVDGAPTADAADAAEAEGSAGAAEDELAALRLQLAEQHDRLLRTAAELDNLRKRSRREVADARRFAQADVLRPLLEVLDNFERALQHAPPAGTEPDEAPDETPGDAFRQGVALIAQNFRQALHDRGVRRIEAVGRPFDPARHEAVGQAPGGDEAPGGTVLAELQAGYTLDDLVLRASRVIVAQ